MSVTLPTASLLGMLSDLLVTADDNAQVATGGILLATGPGEAHDGRETNVLAGTSTIQKSRLIGHCSEPATGSLPTTLLPGDGARLIVDAFKPLLKIEKRDEIVTHLHVEVSGVMIRVTRVDDGLFSPDTTEDQVRTRQGAVKNWPPSIWATLSDEVEGPTFKDHRGEVIPNGPRRAWPLDALRRFEKVAARRKSPLETYSPHAMSATHIQVGPSYRGMIPAPSEHDGITQKAPSALVHVPDLPDQELTPVLRAVG